MSTHFGYRALRWAAIAGLLALILIPLVYAWLPLWIWAPLLGLLSGFALQQTAHLRAWLSWKGDKKVDQTWRNLR